MTSPAPIPVTAYSLAERFVGLRELAEGDNPLIQYAHSLCGFGPNEPDETAWCSAFINFVAWTLRLPRSKSAMARSWLKVGTPIDLKDAIPAFDVVVFWRGKPDAATGHVGLYAGVEGETLAGDPRDVLVLGGNQGDAVSIAHYPAERLLGVRRLKTA